MVSNQKLSNNPSSSKKIKSPKKRHENTSELPKRVQWAIVIFMIVGLGIFFLAKNPGIYLSVELPSSQQIETFDRKRDSYLDDQKKQGIIANDAVPTLSSKKFICQNVEIGASQDGNEFKTIKAVHCYVRYIDVIPAAKIFSEISDKESTTKFGNVCGSFDGTYSTGADRMSYKIIQSSYVSFYREDDILPTEPIAADSYMQSQYLPKIGDYKFAKLGEVDDPNFHGSYYYELCGIPDTTTTYLLWASDGHPFNAVGYEKAKMAMKTIRDFPHEEGSVDGFYGSFVLAPSLDIDKDQDYIVNVYEQTYRLY